MLLVVSLVGKLQKGLDAKYANEKGMVDVYFTHVSNDSDCMRTKYTLCVYFQYQMLVYELLKLAKRYINIRYTYI